MVCISKSSIAAFRLIQLSLRGVINSFGIYQEFYQSGLLKDKSPSSISWIGTVQSCLLEVVGVFVGPVYDKGHFYALVYCGSCLIVLGTMTLSLCTTYWQIFLAQGLCVGLGSGLVFIPGVSIIAALFTKRRAIAIGIISSASSIGEWERDPPKLFMLDLVLKIDLI